LDIAIISIGMILAVVAGVAAYKTCGPYGEQCRTDPRVRRVYDSETGRLRLLIYDADGNGRFDTWSFMDGERLLRMEIDEDEDGVTDRSEEYGPDGQLLRSTRRNSVGTTDSVTVR
jgi:hypothetical protein